MLNLILRLFHTIKIQGRELYFHGCNLYTLTLAYAYEQIISQLGMVISMAVLYSKATWLQKSRTCASLCCC